MTRSTATDSARPRRSVAAKAVFVGLAAAAFAGLGAGAAYAGDPMAGDFPDYTHPPSAGSVAWEDARSKGLTEYNFEAFRQTLSPWGSIMVPSMRCPGGFLQNSHFSPGRIVPNGVEVIEPGGVGVSIFAAHRSGSATWSPTGTTIKLDGTDAVRKASSATNWDPFTSRELVIKLHCTTDGSKAATEFLPLGIND